MMLEPASRSARPAGSRGPRALLLRLAAALFAASLCAGGCELIAGVRDTTFVGEQGTGGGQGIGGQGTGGQGTGGGPSADAGAPPTPVPPGYATYCSIVYPGGNWRLETTIGDPCGTYLAAHPGGSIERAGLYATGGDNNVLVQCDGALGIFRGEGVSILTLAGAWAIGDAGSSRTRCTFTVAPLTLPVFGLPYGVSQGQTDPNADVDTTSFVVFNFDLYDAPWDVTMFGRAPSPPGTLACAVDRLGQQQCYLASTAGCQGAAPPASCRVQYPGRAIEGYYAWGMPVGKPLVAIADGIVRGSLARNVPSQGCTTTVAGSTEEEVYVEHSVGSGLYAERFIAAYAGLSQRSVVEGQVVSRGQEIGRAGTTGCPAGMGRLVFRVLRLTNLTGGSSYVFATTQNSLGFNGIQGAIDPAGWDAPEGVDPWAWRFADMTTDPYGGYPPPIAHPGAFSINLWLPGQAPPSFQGPMFQGP